MNDNQKKGFDLMLGFLWAFSLFYTLGFIVAFFINPYIESIDPTDKDAHTRSGLHYYKDYGTGKEYIGDGCNLIERNRL